MKRGTELYLVVDSDHHRDDIYRLFETQTQALIAAQTAVNDAVRGTNRTFKDYLNERARASGWLFLVSIGEEGDGVSVRKVTLE